MKCGKRRDMVSSHKEPDHYEWTEKGTPILVGGREITLYNVCGRRRGHSGECSSGCWNKFGRWRRKKLRRLVR